MNNCQRIYSILYFFFYLGCLFYSFCCELVHDLSPPWWYVHIYKGKKDRRRHMWCREIHARQITYFLSSSRTTHTHSSSQWLRYTKRNGGREGEWINTFLSLLSWININPKKKGEGVNYNNVQPWLLYWFPPPPPPAKVHTYNG